MKHLQAIMVIISCYEIKKLSISFYIQSFFSNILNPLVFDRWMHLPSSSHCFVGTNNRFCGYFETSVLAVCWELNGLKEVKKDRVLTFTNSHNAGIRLTWIWKRTALLRRKVMQLTDNPLKKKITIYSFFEESIRLVRHWAAIQTDVCFATN